MIFIMQIMKISITPLVLVFHLSLCCWTSILSAAPIHIAPDNPSGVYKVNDTVVWTILRDLSVKEVNYNVKRGGQTSVESGRLEFVGNQATLQTPFNAPGALLLEVSWTDADGEEQRALGGAVASPSDILMSLPPPEDFNEFWESKIEQLQSIPPNPKLHKVELETGENRINYWKIRMNHVGGSQIRGQIARPDEERPYPALLIPQWAGVYPLQKEWITSFADQGWLVLNILAHDLPIDEEESYYETLKAGPLGDYYSIGNTDRETYYFLRMYLSCYRAAEYLTRRPDWDGQTLVVMGGSQGGQQALVTAGLHPKVTAALANVPAGCDLTGEEVGRQNGFPTYFWNPGILDSPAVRKTARYFDVGNFTSNIQCPVLVGIGLLDEVCSPEGIFAAINGIPDQSRVEQVIMPQAPHGNVDGAQEAYNQRANEVWLPALLETNTPPTW